MDFERCRGVAVRAALLLLLLGAAALFPALPIEPLGPAPQAVVTEGGGDQGATAVGDFNGDGALDLAVSGQGNSVLILIGDGLGSLVLTSEVEVGNNILSAVAFAVGDFNGDGALDLAAAYRWDGSVGILLGDGAGGFVNSANISGLNYADSLAVGDFNADGALDLAVRLQYEGMRILLGDGLGGFTYTSARTVEVAQSRGPMVSLDFNLDGILDLAVVARYGTSLTILRGDGSGGFAYGGTIAVGQDPAFIAVGDFDANGTSDLAVANSADDTVSIILRDGSGGYARVPDVMVGSGPRSIAVGDFDGDGAQDLAVANTSGDSVSVLLGDGTGRFAVTSSMGVGNSPTSIIAGDFIADGILDLAVTCTGTIGLFPGDGLGGFLNDFEFGVGDWPWVVVTDDFNNDGALDLAVTNHGPYVSEDPGSVSILLGDGLGMFERGPVIEVGPEAGTIVPADFNSDGNVDLAVASQRLYDSDSLSILLGDGLGGFHRTAEIEAGEYLTSVVAGDFNSDHNLDLILGSSRVQLLLGEGTGEFSPPIEPVDIDILGSGRTIDAGDFNGDDMLDLAVAHTGDWSGFVKRVAILLGNGMGGFSLASDTEVLSPGPSAWSLATADLNLDGALDIVVSGGAEILLGDGEGGLQHASYGLSTGSRHNIIHIGDFTLDGIPDLGVVDPGSLRILAGDGNGGFRLASDIGGGDYGQGAVADFNADGLTDIAIPSGGSDSVRVLFGQLPKRADVNGSNRIDGFDIAMLGRLFGQEACAPLESCDYRRSVDVDLDGIIDGDDLTWIALRFGELNKQASPLRGALEGVQPVAPGTVTLQPDGTEGDLISVKVLANEAEVPSAAADFAVTFEPADDGQGQVLDLAGFRPGTFMSGIAAQIYSVDTGTPGRAYISVSRFPSENRVSAGQQPMMDLLFRCIREGQAALDFAPYHHPRATLLGVGDHVITDVTFEGGATVVVDASAGGPPGQKIAFSPDVMDFGEVVSGSSSRRMLRIANSGYSELRVTNIASTLREFDYLYSADAFPFTVPPYGFVELPVVFTPTRMGIFSGELIIESNDPGRPDIHVPLLGSSELDLAVSPRLLDFGRGAIVGGERAGRVALFNRGASTLTLTSMRSTDAQFVPTADFTTLGPGVSGQIDVRFLPQSEGEHRGFLLLGFDAPEDKLMMVGLSGFAEPDVDSDGLIDRLDNCPGIGNVNQVDADTDGVGDVCDGCPFDPDNDVDDDGICGDVDNCPFDFNPDQAESDGDGIADACDPYPDIALKVRPLEPYVGWVNQPLTMTYQLEDAEGNVLDDVVGARATLTLDGYYPWFGTSASQGLLIEGGGTNRVLVEFVGGAVVLEINDTHAQVVTLGVEDSEGIGIDIVRGGEYEDFEADDGGFTADGLPDGWEWGVPSFGATSAVSGERVWGTNLDGPYPIAVETGLIEMTLLSPEYEIPASSYLLLGFWSWFESEEFYDPGYVDITLDGGASWFGIDSFEGSSGGYTLQSYDLPQYTGSTVRFRFRLVSDVMISYAGWYIDDFAIGYSRDQIEFREPVRGSE